jgi:peroxiredoxin
MNRRASMLLFTLFLVACGKGGPGKSSPAAEAQAPADTVRTKLAPGMAFPAVDLTDLEENKVTSASIVAGRASIVLFVDPDCEACRDLLAVWDKRAGDLPPGLNVIGITVVDAQVAKQWKQDSGFPFPLYCDDQGFFARDYRIKMYPTVVGVYPDGGVAYVGKGVTPEFTPRRAAGLLAEAMAAKRQREGRE